MGVYRQEMRAFNLPVVLPSTNQLNNGWTGTLSADSVAQHNTPSDCWIIVAGKVYAVSGYLSKHPGGAGKITPYCGKDTTPGFASRGGAGRHPSFAQQELASLLLGPVGGSVDQSAILNANQNTVAAHSRCGEDYEYDD